MHHIHESLRYLRIERLKKGSLAKDTLWDLMAAAVYQKQRKKDSPVTNGRMLVHLLSAGMDLQEDNPFVKALFYNLIQTTPASLSLDPATLTNHAGAVDTITRIFEKEKEERPQLEGPYQRWMTEVEQLHLKATLPVPSRKKQHRGAPKKRL
jgi:hypothetical protein